MGRRASSNLTCITFVAERQRFEPYTNAPAIIAVSPMIMYRIIFHKIF